MRGALLEIPSTRNQWYWGNFDARLVRLSASEIGFEKTSQRQWINGISQNDDWAPECANTDFLIDATGARTASAPAGDQFLYAYASASGELALSETAPAASQLGGRYLDATGLAASWLHVGYVNTSNAEFVDTDEQRNVISWYARKPKRLLLRPGYVDDNAATAASVTAATWDPLGTVAFISNGQDDVPLFAQATINGTLTGVFGIGCGQEGAPDLAIGLLPSGAVANTSCSARHVLSAPAEGPSTATLLIFTSGNAVSVLRDAARNGLTADPSCTYLVGWVMG